MANTVTITQMQDVNGNPITPLTPEEAIYDQNGERLNDKVRLATTEHKGLMSAGDKTKLDSNTDKIQGILGTTNIIFDFATGSVSAYQKRIADYNFIKGKTYKIEVITNDDTTKTYFSLRNSSDPETALQNKLGEGKGARSFLITAEENANSLCMSLAESGVAIAYDVIVTNMSDVNLRTLGNSVSKIANSLSPLYSFFTILPTLDDFVDGIYLNTMGNIVSNSQYKATEEYFPVKKGTTLCIRSYQYSSNPHLCVYDTEKNFVKSYGAGGTFIDTITFDSDCYIRVSTVNIYMREAQYVLKVADGSKQSLEYKSDYIGVPVYSDFEIGNITITTSGWIYTAGNKRVRLKEGVTYHLERGDKIEMNEDVRCYIGYRIGDTYFNPTPSEWFKDSFIIPEEGDYTLLFAKIEEDNNLSSVYDILKNVKIYCKKLKNDSSSQAVEEDVTDLLSTALPTMRVVNHRGYCGEAPENTESAYILSKLNGFEYVETDVRFTSDNIPVLLHDTTIDRTSNGTGNISEMTYEEVSQYDFGSWFNAKYAGEKILTFDRFMMLCKKMGLKPYIEMKSIPTGLEQTLIDIVDKYGMRKYVSWISFSDSILRRILAILPDARVGYVGDISEEIITTAASLKNETNEVFIDIQGSSNPKPTVELVLSARSQGLGIEMWNHYGSPDLYPHLDGITTDNLKLWEWSNGEPVWSL